MKLGAFIVAVTAAVGCAKPRPAPVAALNQYSDALRAGDYDRAYGMMSESFRETHSREEYVRALKDNEGEVRGTAEKLGSDPTEIAMSAEFRYGAGETMRLVLEDGVWRIATQPVVFYGQDTPRDALRSFVRAYRLERWDIMLRLVPEAYAARMSLADVERQFQGPRQEEVELMMSSIEAHIDAPIQLKGAEARMPYANGEVVFVREDGRWKIKDPMESGVSGADPG